MRIGFVGGGVMSEALVAGIIRGNVAKPKDIVVSDISSERRSILSNNHQVNVVESNLDALDKAGLLILAIKPQNLPEVMAELSGHIGEDQVVLSIVAGARLSTLSRGLSHQAVLRAMPNAPAQEGMGTSVWIASANLPSCIVNAVRLILQSLGQEFQVQKETYLDMATALSASGPAYLFTFAEALIDSGVYLGLPRELARQLVIHTILGSTVLMDRRNAHPADLRDMVSSPGGTTIEALYELERGGFRATLMNAVLAAYDKAELLGKE